MKDVQKGDDSPGETIIKDISEASELFNISLLSKKIRKYYLCYQRI